MSVKSEIQKKNPQYKILDITDERFNKYGIVYENFNIEELKEFMDRITIPERNEYVPQNIGIEKMQLISNIKNNIFGGMNISAGECVGHSNSFSAIEFHQGSEVNITFTDVLMVLGKRQDIRNNHFNAETDSEIFFVPSGTIFEMYSDTLHYAPIDVFSSGFKVVVIVLQGTNEALPDGFNSTNKMLVKKNKFQLAHRSRSDKIRNGILEGVDGNLIKITPLSLQSGGSPEIAHRGDALSSEDIHDEVIKRQNEEFPVKEPISR